MPYKQYFVELISIHSLRVEGDRQFFSRESAFLTFQSTPSVWRETRAHLLHRRCVFVISIHSLRVEGDYLPPCCPVAPSPYFNPLPPCGGRRFFVQALCNPAKISIHSLRVEGDLGHYLLGHLGTISIHSLRVEGDVEDTHIFRRSCLFQSTPSVWRETKKAQPDKDVQRISIHSLRVEGDGIPVHAELQAIYFNPLPPCGGRPSPNR